MEPTHTRGTHAHKLARRRGRSPRSSNTIEFYILGLLTSSEDVSLQSLKKGIIKEDLSSLLTSAISHPSQRYVQASSEGSWPKVWDAALERGVFVTICSLAVLRLLSLHTFSDKKCPVPDCTHVVETTESPCVHFLSSSYEP